MASSLVPSMFLFLLLLLVVPHIDNVLGARMELRELGGSRSTRALGRLPPTRRTFPPYRRPTRCRFCKPPPPPKAFPRNTPSH
ncbi:unnamed protein product [Arabidopsis thaliana]|uniref:Transmembrane protein n=1 Tax=Arabidopsis thaliana TaxID=3702 RepID=A0A5S9WLW7_ARATH|nr:unnamed protein product [Arabidopsis thaliana]